MNGGKNKLPASKPDASYDVGYAKPRKQSQFSPGKSGYPKGRPKGSKNKRPALNDERLKTIVLDEAYRIFSVRDGHRNVPIVRRQGFWDRWLPELREGLAHLVGLIMRRICGESICPEFRWCCNQLGIL